MIKYKLIRSNRKTLSFKIKDDASLEVRAPLNYPKKEIDLHVKSNEEWINKHISKVIENNKLKENFNLNFGDYITIIGKKTLIKPVEGNIAQYENDSFLIPKECDSNQIKEIIISLSKKIAKKHLTQRVIFYKDKLGVEPIAVKVNSAKTRWGSCSSKKSINFSWRIIMAQEDIIDYVVVHELAHIKEMNHSKKFWAEVENVLPNYLESRAKLKVFSKKLSLENWD